MSLLTSAGPKHRADTVIAALRAENTELRAENAELRAMVIDGDQHATASELRGMQTATELDTARQRNNELQIALRNAVARHAEQVAGMRQENADLQHRLDIGVLANAAADETQPIPTDTVRLHVATVQHLSALNPNADTVQLPITDPAHLPGAA